MGYIYWLRMYATNEFVRQFDTGAIFDIDIVVSFDLHRKQD